MESIHPVTYTDRSLTTNYIRHCNDLSLVARVVCVYCISCPFVLEVNLGRPETRPGTVKIQIIL